MKIMPVENSKKALEYATQFFRLGREQEKTSDSALLAESIALANSTRLLTVVVTCLRIQIINCNSTSH